MNEKKPFSHKNSTQPKHPVSLHPTITRSKSFIRQFFFSSSKRCKNKSTKFPLSNNVLSGLGLPRLLFSTYRDGICKHIRWFSVFQGMDFRQMTWERVKTYSVSSFGRLQWPFVAVNTERKERKKYEKKNTKEKDWNKVQKMKSFSLKKSSKLI